MPQCVLYAFQLNFWLANNYCFCISRFPSLFGEIENEIHGGGSLGIDSYGTSMPTLEEVFLRLGDDEHEENSEKIEANKIMPEKMENENDIVGYEFESVSTKKNWWQTYSALLYVRSFS